MKPADVSTNSGTMSQPLKLLLVEDEAVDVILVRSLLQREGPGRFEMQSVDGLGSADIHLKTHQVDVVLLDLSLRDSSGLKTLETLHRAHPEVPIVVLTGAGEELGLAAVKCGAEDYLDKAELNAVLLIRSVRYVVERYRRHSLQRLLEAVETKLDMAREIQNHLFPGPPRQAGLDVWGSVRPADVSGDFYDFLSLDQDRLLIVLGDVTGHGFDSALLMATARAYIRAIVHTLGCHDLGKTMHEANLLLSYDVGDERFVSLSMVLLDCAQWKLSYVSAGQPPAYLVSENGELRELVTPKNLPLGIEAGVTYRVLETHLSPGDTLAMATDGVIEACSPENVFFDNHNLIRGLQAHRKLSAREIVSHLYQDVETFTGSAPQRDDLTLVIAKVFERRSP
jgi:sigma-B regulation protein RsbU (phosphoserine phosphatase)